ncbi:MULTISPECIES: aromatic ring-hydroxylating oxygenase subunit alpha [Bacillaceae]|uniref:Aromatic ring-hydroxylating dioxygenase subunit alpha n=1 Tax=Evansella alkalicola TaxID=745819 RepID=A0ABS6K2C4_9BACI|nr:MULTISPECIES: aromatic ring-hydroxylating dioxygenase subunit alpha [Bacillaceae]MBU9723870.1 aromatic ring-hydroxylating dioxygenase subunit alpha [Bacillus alkalicola]
MLVEDQVLRNDWIVASKIDDVKEAPLQVTILGERVVLFRNEEGIHAFKDLCIHRGAALSLGCVKDGNLVCAYHGWEYDSDGACKKIPQLPEGRQIPLKAKAIKFSTKEAYGFVWVNLNNNEPELFHYPEFSDDSYRHVLWGPQEVNANPPRIVENFLDVGHLAFIHEGFLGVQEHPVINDYDIHWEDDRVYSDEIAIFQPDPDGSGESKDVYYTYEVNRPLSVRFTKRDPDTNNKFTILLTILPVAERKSIAYGVMSFNYENELSDEKIVEFQDMIFAQDKPIVENQKPEDLPLDLQVELSLKCDMMSIAYRKYLKKLGVTLGTE